MFKKRKKFSPIMTFIILTLATILLSGFLNLLNIQSEYKTINKATNDVINNVIEVNVPGFEPLLRQNFTLPSSTSKLYKYIAFSSHINI